MKKIVAILITLAFVLVSSRSYTNRSGPGGGYSGAPGEGTCVSCHSGTSLNGGSGKLSDLKLTNNFSGTGYKTDSTYQFTLEYSQSSINRFGFNLSAVVVNDSTNAGSLTVTSSRIQKRTRTAAGGKSRQYLEHTSSGTSTTSSNKAEWDFEWKAPSSNVGKVRFYVTVNAANSNSGTSGDQIYFKTFEYNIDGLPVATANAKDTLVCQNETVSLTGTGTNSPTDYSWIFPDGSPSVSTKQNPTVSYSGFGKKYAILQVKNSIGWSEKDTQIITVQQSPTAFISGSGTRTICPGDSVEIVAQFNPQYSYEWSNGVKGTNKIWAKDTGSYFVTTKSGNCSRISNTIVVRHHSITKPTLTSTWTQDSICELDEVPFETSTGYDSVVLYNAFKPVFTTTATKFNAQVNDTADFRVRGYDGNGCLSMYSDAITYQVFEKDVAPKVTCTDRSPFSVAWDWTGLQSHNGAQISLDSGKVWRTPSSGQTGNSHTLSGLQEDTEYEVWVRGVTGSPCFYSEVTRMTCRTGKCEPIDFSISADSVICSGDEVTVEINGLKDKWYSLSLDGGGTFTDTMFNFSPQVSATYQLSVIDSTVVGCKPSVDSFTVRVDNIGNLFFRTQRSSNTFCVGDTIEFRATSGNDEYKFYVNNTLRSTSQDSFYYESQFQDEDSAYVTVSKGACEATSAKIYLSVFPTPDPGFSYTSDGSLYTFTPNNVNYKTYFWDFGDGFTSVLMKPDHSYRNSSNQKVTVMLDVEDNNSCVASSEQEIDLPDFSSVSELTLGMFKVYPNPAQSSVTVSRKDALNTLFEVRLVHPNGQVIRHISTKNNEISLDLTNFAVGIYVIEIETDGQIVRQRFIKN